MRRRTYQAEAHKAAANRLQASLVVFLGGPYIDPKNERTAQSNEAKARYYLFHRIKEEYGIMPSIGEHNEMKNIGRAKFERMNNAHLYELDFVIKSANCVILLPSSPGSYCELGVFSDYENICSKMLILMDKKYKTELQSYINLGPVPMARKNGAKIRHVDLTNKSTIWRASKDHIERRISSALHRDLRG